MVVIVDTDDQTYHAGTTDELNKLLSNSRNVAGMINIDSTDDNNDGKAEELRVNIGLTGIDPNEVKSIVILQSINYGINVSVQTDFIVSVRALFY